MSICHTGSVRGAFSMLENVSFMETAPHGRGHLLLTMCIM